MKNKNNISPPRWADRFLAFYCKEEFLEEIQGDAHELFARKTEESVLKAKAAFIWDVLRFFKPSNIKTSNKVNSNYITMTRNNFKVAARVLWRQKTNTSLNVFGMAIGMACFLLIGLYVRQEVTFDTFHQKKDNIYRAWVKEVYEEGRVFFNTVTPLPLGMRLEEYIPEVEEFVLFDSRETLVGRGDGRITDDFNIVSPNFFDVFDFEVIQGDPKQPFADLSSIILSKSYAIKYFGQSDAMGQTIALQVGGEVRDFIVSAVVQDPPLNSGFKYTMLLSLENRKLFYSDGMMNAWFNIGPETYVVLKDGTDPAALTNKTRAMVSSVIEAKGMFGDELIEDHYLIGFQALTDIHLNADVPSGRYPVSNPQYVYILGAIGLLVLVIACMNYATLSIGQSIKRAKEVGVRKVVGALPQNLVRQYLAESTTVAILASLIGVLFTRFALPVFNQLAQTNLLFDMTSENVIIILGLTISIGVLSGIYPAFILSQFKIVNILKGNSQSNGGKWVRNGMITFQFLLTIFLLSSTLIMRKQMSYMQQSDLGYTYDARVSVPLFSTDGPRVSQQISSAFANGELLKNELSKYTSVEDLGMGSHVFGSPRWMKLGFDATEDRYLSFQFLIVDPYFLKSFDIEMAVGTAFNPELEIHKSQGVILNETAVEYFGLENPIGQKLPGDRFGEHIIIGVVEDFNYESLKEDIEPLVIVQNPLPIFEGVNDFTSGDSFIPKLVFKYTGNSLTEVAELLEAEWPKVFPGEELNFYFVEQHLQNQYLEEARVNKIVTIATILSIMIAGFGLLGLTILIVNTKLKEIGIRKVLGAAPSTIFQLMFKQFSWQVLIAILLAVPLTWWIMNRWLTDFAYRTNIGFDPFIFSVIGVLLIIGLVIGFHALRASKINPIRTLRVE